MSDLTNLGNPLDNLHDWEQQNAPRVTPIPPEAGIRDDMFGDSPIHWDLSTATDEQAEKAPQPSEPPRDESGRNP